MKSPAMESARMEQARLWVLEEAVEDRFLAQSSVAVVVMVVKWPR